MKKLFVLVCLFVIGFCNVVWVVKWQVKYVVLIVLDGWGVYSVFKVDIFNIKSLMDEGCYIFYKCSVFLLLSVINWVFMFMGVGIEFYGYIEWGLCMFEILLWVVNEYGIFFIIFLVMC